jgi:hypothetical protein
MSGHSDIVTMKGIWIITIGRFPLTTVHQRPQNPHSQADQLFTSKLEASLAARNRHSPSLIDALKQTMVENLIY